MKILIIDHCGKRRESRLELRERYFETIHLVAGNVATGVEVNLANVDKPMPNAS